MFERRGFLDSISKEEIKMALAEYTQVLEFSRLDEELQN